MKMSDVGLNLLCKFEGFRNRAYRDSVGVLTIGYGHTSRAGSPVVTPGMEITEEQGKSILASDVSKFEAAVLRVLKTTPNQNQFDAMVSLCYNIGPGAFGGSHVVQYYNAGEMALAGAAFMNFVHAGGKVLPGLVTRRGLERDLFMTKLPTTTISISGSGGGGGSTWIAPTKTYVSTGVGGVIIPPKVSPPVVAKPVTLKPYQVILNWLLGKK